jgi:hypothetical protein
MNTYENDAGNDDGLDGTQGQAVAAVKPADAAIQHAEPQGGGSYVRDMVTGALIRVAGEPAEDQPAQE